MAKTKAAGEVAQRVAQGTAASPTTSATPAGQTDPEQRAKLVEAINQVFALFRLNFHNQFYAAYSDSEQLNLIKRLWLETLVEFSPDVILRGAKHAIETSEYLPTLNRMRESCQHCLVSQGVPSPRAAYLEACDKPSPKHEQQWTHPIVYFAGRDSDWFFLANNPEAKTWPVFEKHYQGYLLRLSRGECFELPEVAELPKPETAPMTDEQRQNALAALREEVGL